ncbi:MAG: glycosyltransferase family 39 protein [Candidatus Aminicenantales bacterium]
MKALLSKLAKLKPWIIPGAIFAAGVFFRVWSLWRTDLDIDEAWRAMIVSSDAETFRSPATVPPMTMLLPRLAVAAFGNTETTLRLPGFLCGLGSLVLIFLLTRQIAGRTAAVLAIFLLAFQPEYIHYDTIFKQYPYEVFFVLALLYSAERVLARGNGRDRLLFAATAVAGVFFATALVHLYPAVFIVWNEWKKSKKFPAYSFGIAGAALAASIADYLFILRVEDTGGLNAYWGGWFVSGKTIGASLSRLAGMTFEIFRQFLYHPSGVLENRFYRPIAALFCILAIVGCIRFFKERRFRFVAYTITPLLILAAYAFVKLWPFGANRVNLFYFPLLMIAAAVGASSLWNRLKAARGAGPVAAALLAAAFCVTYVPVRQIRGFISGTDQLRTPIRRLLSHYRPGDAVLTRDNTNKIFRYYSLYYAPFKKYRQPMNIFEIYRPWGKHMERRRIPPEETQEIIRRHFQAFDRIWVVFKWDNQALEEEAVILKAAQIYGKQRWALERGSYMIFLFLPRENAGSDASDSFPEPEDPKNAHDVALPDHGIERSDPAPDEPGTEIE